MKMLFILCAAFFPASLLMAQKENSVIIKGNEAYRLKEYGKAVDLYRQALDQSPNNPIAAFNLGNAMFRDSMQDKAMEHYESIGKSKAETSVRGDAFYNKGVVLSSQKKLGESISAYKQALRLNPTDTLARQNLQRAINELKKQEQQNNQKNQQQKKKPEKLNKQQVMQMLQALQEQEKMLQQKLNKSKVPAPVQPGKDW